MLRELHAAWMGGHFVFNEDIINYEKNALAVDCWTVERNTCENICATTDFHAEISKGFSRQKKCRIHYFSATFQYFWQ